MNSNRSSCEVGRAVKRRRGEEEEEDSATTDRLSRLPDSIIHHILSFLDTKSVVQTAVLSPLWRSTWKHVPVLRLDSSSFQLYSSFQRFVENVLSLRHPFNVRELLFVVSEQHYRLHYGEKDEGKWIFTVPGHHHHNGEEVVRRYNWEEKEEEDRRNSLVAKVAKYALSHDPQHIELKLSGIVGMSSSYGLSKLFALVSNCNLTTLELRCVRIDSEFGASSFPMLKTLELSAIQLASDKNGVFDLSSNCPQLENLVMDACSRLDCHGVRNGTHLKILGPELLTLQLDVLWFSSVEIFAPKLEFFSIYHVLDAVDFSKLSFPSLDRAIIEFDNELNFLEGNEDSVAQCLVSLFQGLSNATFLRLEPNAVQILDDSFFQLLEQPSSPFTRLKSLIVTGNIVPYSLLTYFLEGSSVREPTLEFIQLPGESISP